MKTQQELLRQIEAALRMLSTRQIATWYHTNQANPTEGYYAGWDNAEYAAKQALPAIDELLRMSAWKPIESAPKDGTNVLVWWSSRFHCPVTAHYNAGKWSDAGIGWKISGWGDAYHDEPTHWMPLPLVPQPDDRKPLETCPKCGGYADNGHDRCLPPSPYWCSKCQPQPDEGKL